MRANAITRAKTALLRTAFPEAAPSGLQAAREPGSDGAEHIATPCNHNRVVDPRCIISSLWDVDMFVLHNDTLGAGRLLPDLSKQLKSVTAFGHVHSAFQKMRGISDREAVFVVDIDIFDTTETAVEELISLRRNALLLSVIMVSRDFRRNDFSAERRIIADCSLSLPTTEDILSSGIHCALENTGQRLLTSRLAT